MEKMFNNYVVSEYMTWQEFNNMKGSYPEGTLPTSFQVPWDAKKVGQKPRSNPWSDYAKLPEGKGLDTKSGKIEFYSQWLKEWFPDDTERLPVAHFKPSWEGLESPLAQKYPLLVDSGHPRFRHHTQFDDCPWLWEIPSNKVMIDGYPYEALWINPKDGRPEE